MKLNFQPALTGFAFVPFSVKPKVVQLLVHQHVVVTAQMFADVTKFHLYSAFSLLCSLCISIHSGFGCNAPSVVCLLWLFIFMPGLAAYAPSTVCGVLSSNSFPMSLKLLGMTDSLIASLHILPGIA